LKRTSVRQTSSAEPPLGRAGATKALQGRNATHLRGGCLVAKLIRRVTDCLNYPLELAKGILGQMERLERGLSPNPMPPCFATAAAFASCHTGTVVAGHKTPVVGAKLEEP
jgi:hypothetical protein